MRFPNYESYESASCQPLDGYMAYVGQRNSLDPYTTYKPQTKQHAVALLAQGCTQLTVERNPHLAKKTLLDAQRVLAATEGLEAANNESTLGLSALIHTVVFRNQSSRVAQARESLHVDVMKALGEALHRVNSNEVQSSLRRGLPKTYTGKINQLTALGIFTRLGAHPWIGAWPALDYHDAPKKQATRSKNVDIILGETTPSMEVPEIYGLQVKSACLGFCGKDRGTHFEDPRTEYDREVILVSAECDLGYNSVNRRHDFPVTKLLREEYKNTITPDRLMQLDQVGNDLLLAITGASEGRRGLLPNLGA